jgi:hypothetical protein
MKKKKKKTNISLIKYPLILLLFIIAGILFYCFYYSSYKPPVLYGPNHPIKMRAPASQKKSYEIYRHFVDANPGAEVERLLPPQELPQMESKVEGQKNSLAPAQTLPISQPAAKDTLQESKEVSSHFPVKEAPTKSLSVKETAQDSLAKKISQPAPANSSLTHDNYYILQVGNVYSSFQQAKSQYAIFKKKCALFSKFPSFFQKYAEKNKIFYRIILKNVPKTNTYKKDLDNLHVPYHFIRQKK